MLQLRLAVFEDGAKEQEVASLDGSAAVASGDVELGMPFVLVRRALIQPAREVDGAPVGTGKQQAMDGPALDATRVRRLGIFNESGGGWRFGVRLVLVLLLRCSFGFRLDDMRRQRERSDVGRWVAAVGVERGTIQIMLRLRPQRKMLRGHAALVGWG